MTWNHDKVGKCGFDVQPDQLAHDLALIKLVKSSKITDKSNEWEIYDTYVKELSKFKVVIDDKTRYDSTFSK